MSPKAQELIEKFEEIVHSSSYFRKPHESLARAREELEEYITELETKAKAWDKQQADKESYMRFANLRTKSASSETKAHLSGTDAGSWGTKAVDPPDISP